MKTTKILITSLILVLILPLNSRFFEIAANNEQNKALVTISNLPSSIPEEQVFNSYETAVVPQDHDQSEIFIKEFTANPEPVTGFIVHLNSLENKLEDILINVNFINGFKKEFIKFEEEDVQIDENTKFQSDKSESSSYISSVVYSFPEQVISVEVLNASGNVDVTPVDTSVKKGAAPASINEFTLAKKKFYSNMGFNIITREEWGAPQESAWLPGKASTISKIVVHHTAGNVDNANPANEVRRVYNMHYFRCANNSGSYNPNNPHPNCDEPAEWWEDIGYNFLIDQNGTIYEGRAGGLGVTGAHSPPNSGTIGIVILGTYTHYYPTGQAIEALKYLIAGLSNIYNLQPKWGHNSDPTVTVTGHYTRQNTACPGAKLIEILPTITIQAAQLKSFNDNNIAPVKSSLDKMQIYHNGDSGKERVVLNKTGKTQGEIDYIKRYIVNTNDYIENQDYIFFNVDKPWLRSVMLHALILDKGVQMQPNRKYEFTTWTTNSNKSTHSSYDPSILWNLEQVNVPQAWNYLSGCTSNNTCGGESSVVVAVVDSGVAYEDYTLDAGGDYVTETFVELNLEYPQSSTPNGIVNEGYDRIFNKAPIFQNTNFVSPFNAAQEYICLLRSFSPNTSKHCNSIEIQNINHANDDHGHGTFVASIIAANPGFPVNSKLNGIAFNVSIMPIKVMLPNYLSLTDTDNDLVGGSTNSVILSNAIRYAVDNGAHVINLSLSGSGTDPMVNLAIEYAKNRNVIVVAAAGNNSQNVANFFPGNSPYAITAGALNDTNQKANYSNFGQKIDVTAPVGDFLSSNHIRSLWFNCTLVDDCVDKTEDNFVSSNFTSFTSPVTALGTSFAAPQVSAVVALMKSKNININLDTVKFFISKSSFDIDTPGKDNNTGWGRLNAEGMVRLADLYKVPNDVYRFYNVRTNAHFYTNNIGERNDVINRLPQFNYEGVTYLTNNSNTSNTEPLYRFYNTRTGTHFYTNSIFERDTVISTLPQFIYEGIGYYVLKQTSPYAKPVYRFYNARTNTHFYTPDIGERNTVINTLPQFTYEGIGFYVL